MIKNIKILAILMLGLLLSGCMMNSKQMIMESPQQLEVRSYQTKTYDKPKLEMSRAVVATLQDLGFIIGVTDMATGTITATRIVSGAYMKTTIVLRSRVENQTVVRVNSQFSSGAQMPRAVTEPETYLAFFSALDKAVFLDQEGI